MKKKESFGLRIAVGIATAGRPNILRETVEGLLAQSRAPDTILVCAPSDADVKGLNAAALRVEIALGVRGLCVQRNVIIRGAINEDIIIFFDDDFAPRADYIEVVEEVFLQELDIVMLTGHVIADGAIGPGFDIPKARAILASDVGSQENRFITEVYNGYGCNMAVRTEPLRERSIFFDEGLPLYGWLEDVDFSRRLAPYGRIVKATGARGVHLGAKSGRQTGRCLGYSQIANPLYLARKGTLSWSRALNHLGRNVAANCLRSFQPEPYVDRRGRITGNAIGLVDLVAGRLDPRRVLEL